MRNGRGTIDIDTRAHRLVFIDRLFVLMQSNYGHLWSSRFGDEKILNAAKADWALSLHPWPERSVLSAMDRCKRLYRKPPTLTEFMDMLRTERVHDEYKALPRPPCDKGKAKAQIEAMRGILKRAS